MLMLKRNVKLSHDVFIDCIYDIYYTMLVYDFFTEKGKETDNFKVWKYKDTCYILHKNSGILISWYKLLGWNLHCNTKLIDADWKWLCSILYSELESNNMPVKKAEDLGERV